jgi:hypothetical protein
VIRSSFAVVVLIAAAACQREPAVIIRFDASDMAGRDLAKAADLTLPQGGAIDLAGAPAAEAKKAEAKGPACKVDADCAAITDGCCDCANGGKLRVVAKKEEAKLVKAQRAGCKDVMCTMAVSNDPTCDKRAACVDGACTLGRSGTTRVP